MSIVGGMEYNWTPPDNYEYTWPPNALLAEEEKANPEDAEEGSIANSNSAVDNNIPEESKELQDIDACVLQSCNRSLREGMRLTEEARERKTQLLRDGITDKTKQQYLFYLHLY
jgi:hypothetical protein